MNERIRELLIEAHKQTKGGIYSGHPAEWSEKFAELIVRECIEVVKWTPSQFPNDEYVKNIKEHFGVRE